MAKIMRFGPVALILSEIPVLLWFMGWFNSEAGGGSLFGWWLPGRHLLALCTNSGPVPEPCKLRLPLGARGSAPWGIGGLSRLLLSLLPPLHQEFPVPGASQVSENWGLEEEEMGVVSHWEQGGGIYCVLQLFSMPLPTHDWTAN